MLLGMMLGGGRFRQGVTLASNGTGFILTQWAALVGFNLNQVVELTITSQSGIELKSIDINYGAIHLSGLLPGSQVNIINNGRFIGADGGGPAIRADFTGNLVLTNGSGYIYGGTPGGYAIQHNAGTTLTWLSGATRITGAVGV